MRGTSGSAFLMLGIAVLLLITMGCREDVVLEPNGPVAQAREAPQPTPVPHATSDPVGATTESTPSAEPTHRMTTDPTPTTAPSASPKPTTPPVALSEPTATPEASAVTEPPQLDAPPDLANHVVVIDPGHNGANGNHPDEISRPVDAGGQMKPCNTVGAATDDGYPEAAFNWEVSLLLQGRLEEWGAEVHLTRPNNEGVGPCIDERGQSTAQVGADALVSVHADGAPPEAQGFHIIRPDNLPGHTEDIVDPSYTLAGHLRDALVSADFTPATYIGEDGIDLRSDLGTLNNSSAPAVMLEAGNMRNPEDAVTFTSDEGRHRIAEAIAEGIADFLLDATAGVGHEPGDDS